MKCIKTCFLSFMVVMLLTFFGIVNVNASNAEINITDIKLIDKSETLNVGETTIKGREINTEINFNELGQYAIFELTLNSVDDELYRIENITDSHENENLLIEYNFDDGYMEKGDTKKVTIKMIYKNRVLNKDNLLLDNLTINIAFGPKNSIINPDTGETMFGIIIVLFALLGVIIIRCKKSDKFFKSFLILIITMAFMPLFALAKDSFIISIKFKNIDLKGEFEKYKISINPNNGSDPSIVEVIYGNFIPELPIPTKQGYDFSRWEDNDGNEVTTSTIITKQTDVNAKYIPKTNIAYTINHYKQKLDLSSYDIPEVEYLNGTADSTVTPPVKTYTGFTSPSTQKVIIKADGSTIINYYYTRNKYNVVFNKNASDAIGSMDNISYKYDENKSLSLNLFSRSGYVFSEWNTKSDGTGVSYTDGQSVKNLTTGNGNVQLYAQWKKSVRILFIGNSLTQDGVAYLPYMLKNYYPDIDFKLYMWYKGSANLSTIKDYFDTNNPAPIFSVAENTSRWTNYENSKTMKNIFESYQFDIISLEEYDYNRSYDDDTLDYYVGSIKDYIYNVYKGNNKDELKYVGLIPAPRRNSVENQYQLSLTTYKKMLQSGHIEDLIPNGISVYNAIHDSDLDNLGDQHHLSPDGVHTQEGLPCLLQTYATLNWLLDRYGVAHNSNENNMRMTTTIYNQINVPGANLGSGVITGNDLQNQKAHQAAQDAYNTSKALVVSNYSNTNSLIQQFTNMANNF